MGVWGTSLYANDCTCDVRDTYMDFLQKQMDKEEAYKRTLEECNQYIGDIDEPFFWYALADTQWRVGRLMPEVKDKAIYWIEKNGGLELWTESKNRGEGWRKTLVKLKERLESPMPPEKRIKSVSPFPRNPWNLRGCTCLKCTNRAASALPQISQISQNFLAVAFSHRFHRTQQKVL